MEVKLSSTYELQYEIKLVLGLEGKLHLNSKMAGQRREQIALSHGVPDLVHSNDELFTNALHGIKLFGVLLLDQKYFAEGALAYNLHHLKILQDNLSVWIFILLDL
jgi:hypothetical protein